MAEVTIDLDKLIEIAQDTAIIKERMLHTKIEDALKIKPSDTQSKFIDLESDWNELTDLIVTLFGNSSEKPDEAGYITQPIEILEFAKRNQDDLKKRVDELQNTLPLIFNTARNGLPHFVKMEGKDAFEVPTHVDANDALNGIEILAIKALGKRKND